jgi:hypothetical protein
MARKIALQIAGVTPAIVPHGVGGREQVGVRGVGRSTELPASCWPGSVRGAASWRRQHDRPV